MLGGGEIMQGFGIKHFVGVFDARMVRIYRLIGSSPDVKVGLERWLSVMSRENALLYGLMSLAIAIIAGWGASAVFRMFRA